MIKTKLSRRVLFIISLTLAVVGIVLGFQNCSKNISSGSTISTKGSTVEINTTKAISIRFDSAVSTNINSGESFEVMAHAEDENGDTVTDFNYTGSVVLNGANTSISICRASTKFVNGILKTTISVLNNSTSASSIGLTIQSTVPTVSPLALNVAAGYPSDTYSYQQISTVGIAPTPRSGATAIYDSAKNRIVIFGGREVYEYYGYVQDGNPLGGIWELKLNSEMPEWNNITPSNSPTPRYGHTFTLDTTKNRGLLFGGTDSVSLASNDVWAFDLQNDSWSLLTTINTSPSPRMNHGATYDSDSKMFYVFSGTDQTNNLNDSFALRLGGQTPNWTATTSSHPAGQVNVLTANTNYCIDPAVPYGCVTDAVIYDTKNTSQWVVGTLAERAPPRTSQQTTQQYKPVLKVLKRIMPVKAVCE